MLLIYFKIMIFLFFFNLIVFKINIKNLRNFNYNYTALTVKNLTLNLKFG
jgi:hypothetical protein